MKRLVTVLMLALFIFSGMFSGAVASITTQKLSSRGEVAVGQLAECIQTAQSLDIYYVIDNSKSLEVTDPKFDRARIIAEDVSRWAEMTELRSELNIRVNGTFFAGSTSNFSGGWQELTLDNKLSIAASLQKEVRAKALAPYTDWEVALQRAKTVLSGSEAECKAVIWFTDGGLWVGAGENRPGNFSALSELCGVEIPNSGSLPENASGRGLIQELRNDGVTLFGVLLNTAPDDDADKLATQENYWRSFMQVLVEESGPTIPGLDGLPSGNFICGLNANDEVLNYSTGAFLEAASAGAVAYPFLLISTQVAGGNLTAIGPGGKFWIDPGIVSYEILTSESTWKITDGSGRVVKSSSSQHSMGTTGKIMVSEIVEPEQFTFSGAGQLVLYPDLSPVLAPKTIFLEEPAELTGHFVHSSDVIADVSMFTAVRLTATADGQEIQTEFNQNSGIFTVDVNRVKSKNLEFKFSLSLETEHYANLKPLTFRVIKNAEDPREYPQVSAIEFEHSLRSGEDSISAHITVSGPESPDVISGTVCFTETEILSDAQDEVGAPVVRADNWGISLSGVDSNACVVVNQGAAVDVQLDVSNETPLNSHVTGLQKFVLYKGVADESPGLEDSRQFHFQTEKHVDLVKALLIFFIAYLVSVGVPMVVLYFLNRNAAKIQIGNEALRASFPVVVDVDAKTMTATQGKALSDPSIGLDEFKYQAPQDAALSIFDADLGQLKAVVPVFPLNSPWYEIVAREGSVVITGNTGGKANPKRFRSGNRAAFDGRLAKFWALTLTEAELLKSVKGGTPARGRLVMYAKAHKGRTPNFSELMANMKFQFENSNSLLEIGRSLQHEQSRANSNVSRAEQNGVADHASANTLPVPPTSSSSGFVSGVVSPPSPSGNRNIGVNAPPPTRFGGDKTDSFIPPPPSSI